MSIVISKNLDLTISGLDKNRNVIINDLEFIFDFEQLGDKVTDGQVIVKKLLPSYRHLDITILNNEETLLTQELVIKDRFVSPTQRYWVAQNEDSTIQIRPGIQGFFDSKWVLDENGIITAYTSEATTTDPWSATWNIVDGHYATATSIVCTRLIKPLWVVVPTSELVGSISGEVSWELV